MAKRGVVEFSIPACELGIPVCAKAKRKAGMVFPISPTIINFIHTLGSMPFIRLKTKGNKVSPAKAIRNAPNSIGEKYSKERFINIKELPPDDDQTKKKNPV